MALIQLVRLSMLLHYGPEMKNALQKENFFKK